MHVSSMTLRCFRNIEKADLCPSPKLNILFGANGQGKTNTIEAVCLALTGKSPRESTSGSFIKHGEEYAEILMNVHSDDMTDPDVGVSISAEGRKHTVNGSRVNSRKALLSMFSAVFFGPDDLRIIKDSPQTRRDFINESVSSLYPQYSEILSRYSKALRQKNVLLRDYSPSSESLLDVYDDTLASEGTSIMKYRIAFLKRLGVSATACYEKLSGGSEDISVTYLSDVLKEAVSPDEIASLYREALSEGRQRDIRAGTTLTGVHRDDVSFLLGGSPAKHFASQGQQRSIALSLRFGLADLIEEKKKHSPVILLDDVMSELDRARRDAVASMISDRQVFITCTYPDFDTPRSSTSYFRLTDGAVTEERIQ